MEIDFPDAAHANLWANSAKYAALLKTRSEAMCLTLIALEWAVRALGPTAKGMSSASAFSPSTTDQPP